MPKFELTLQEYELSENDLNNKELIDELREKRILDDKNVKDLAKFSKGYQASLFPYQEE